MSLTITYENLKEIVDGAVLAARCEAPQTGDAAFNWQPQALLARAAWSARRDHNVLNLLREAIEFIESDPIGPVSRGDISALTKLHDALEILTSI